MVVETPYGVFVAKNYTGYSLKISIPANTGNEFGSPREFLDLPVMDKETFNNFIETLGKFKPLYTE